jgi:hypothetical protein
VDDVDYVWTITDGEAFADIEADAKDPSKAVLTFKESEDSELDEYVTVSVAIKDKESGEEQKSEKIIVRVKNEYYEIGLSDPESFNPDLGVGESMTITPVLNHYKAGQDVEVVDGLRILTLGKGSPSPEHEHVLVILTEAGQYG